MIVQDFLRSGGTLQDLSDKYFITVRRHPAHSNLVLLKYSQQDSPMAEPIVQECRGLILDEAEEWRVICRPFNKFFNYGEGSAAVIDWNTACVQEKLDGSLCTLYWYNGQWNVSTSGSPDAGGNVGDFPDLTFSKLFWKTFNDLGLKLPPHSDVDINYIFELLTPFNRVVVVHKDCKVRLIGVRDRFSGEELSVYSPRAAAREYPTVVSFALNSPDAIVASFGAIDPLHQEGYVVVDGCFNRNKIKHPGYVAIHHLKDGFGIRRILEIVRTQETPEFLIYFPEWTKHFEDVTAALKNLKSTLENEYLQIEDFPDQKTFALEAVKSVCSGCLFMLRAKKVQSVNEYLAKMNIKHLLSLLKLRDTDFET